MSKASHPAISKPEVFAFEAGWHGLRTGYPIAVERCLNQAETFLHEHLYHEVVLVETGSALHRSAEGTRKLLPGDILVIKPHIWHQYLETKSFGIVNCIFDRRILMRQKALLSLMGGAFDFFSKPVRSPATTPPLFLHASPPQSQHLTRAFNVMIREREEQPEDWQGAITIHLLDILMTISRINRGTGLHEEPELSEKARDFVNDIVGYLETHYRENVTLSELSKKFHVSTSYICRLFGRRMGMGVVDYIHYLRIEAACDLLRSGNLPISRIASDVGYDEITYFSRRFRLQLGKSPREYRASPDISQQAAQSGQAEG